jgi:hydroxybutyrate-dimer hydrolase
MVAETESSTALQMQRPSFLRGEILQASYDGESDDLLTGGLGRTGLAALTPADLVRFSDPGRPTPAELRRSAIWNSHFGLIDRTAGGGYGRLFGPGVVRPAVVVGDGKVSGHEYMAYGAAPGGEPGDVVTMVVQIPDAFDVGNACLVVAPSSGSRGVYGAVAPVGEWALNRGFAVVYTDKGTGIGAHDLDRNVVQLINGESAGADAVGNSAHFRVRLTTSERAAYARAWPHRFAFKHAHSERNPERYWGEDVLRAVRFAFYILNQHFGSTSATPELTRRNTPVIASGISNGGAASLRAAEEDWQDLIDAVVVSEPGVQPLHDRSFVIVQGSRTFTEHGRPLLDYMTGLNLFQACASLRPELFDKVPGNLADDPEQPGASRNSASAARCRALHELGLLKTTTVQEQAEEAQRIINEEYGLLEEQNWLQPLHHFLYVPQAIGVTYANAYGRFGVADNLCGYSFAATDASAAAAPLPPAAEAALFAVGNGIPPTGGVNLINNTIDGGGEDRASTPDQNLAGALHLHRLIIGRDPQTGQQLSDAERQLHRRIRIGIEQVRASGVLRGKPAVIVNGRADAVVAPNHASRAYYGRNQLVEGSESNLRYYEVTNAHHLDAWNGLFPPLAERFVPLHFYLLRALDLMYDHLRDGQTLPPSQVIHARPRGRTVSGEVPPLEIGTHVPLIDAEPSPEAGITFADSKLMIPD